MLDITSPGDSFERYRRRLSELTREGGAEKPQVRMLANEYGITFATPSEDPSRRRGDTLHDAFWQR